MVQLVVQTKTGEVEPTVSIPIYYNGQEAADINTALQAWENGDPSLLTPIIFNCCPGATIAITSKIHLETKDPHIAATNVLLIVNGNEVGENEYTIGVQMHPPNRARFEYDLPYVTEIDKYQIIVSVRQHSLNGLPDEIKDYPFKSESVVDISIRPHPTIE